MYAHIYILLVTLCGYSLICHGYINNRHSFQSGSLFFRFSRTVFDLKSSYAEKAGRQESSPIVTEPKDDCSVDYITHKEIYESTPKVTLEVQKLVSAVATEQASAREEETEKLKTSSSKTPNVVTKSSKISPKRKSKKFAQANMIIPGKVVRSLPLSKRYTSKDWLHNLKTLPNSTLLKRIRSIVVCNFLWSILVCILNKFAPLPFGKNPGTKSLSLLGSALGLLLVFRTNTAYNRFWEGRKIWENIIVNLRDLAKYTLLYSDVITASQIEKIFNLSCAFPTILEKHLRGVPLDRECAVQKMFLSSDEMKALKTMSNRPYFIVARMSKVVSEITDDGSRFTSRERSKFYSCVDKLSTCVGNADRIIQTPVPMTYARHTCRFVTLFCFLAPVVLVEEFGVYTIPYVTLLTWALFGIMEIGMIIEEPFSVALKLDRFSNTVRRDLSDLLHVAGITTKVPITWSKSRSNSINN